MRNGMLLRSSHCLPLRFCVKHSTGPALELRNIVLCKGTASPISGSIVRRGVKTKASAQLSELPGASPQPQHALPKAEDGGPAYPTVVLQARNNMRKYEKCVLLTRVGSFYEVRLSRSRIHTTLMYGSSTSIMQINTDHSSTSKSPKRRLLLEMSPWLASHSTSSTASSRSLYKT